MNDNAVILGLAVCVTACYVAHQAVNPDTDGPVLAGVVSALVGLATFLYGRQRGLQAAVQ
jgi:hypothetical protein